MNILWLLELKMHGAINTRAQWALSGVIFNFIKLDMHSNIIITFQQWK